MNILKNGSWCESHGPFYFVEKTACVSRRQFLYSDDLFDGSSGFASQAFFCLVQRSDDRLTAFSCL